MHRPTKKLSGPALDRYLRRFFAAEPGLPEASAESLARRSAASFSSVRVRPGAPALPQAPAKAPTPTRTAAPAPATPATRPAPAVAPASETAAPPVQADDAAPFDPFAIGLVPTFQREGREGLIAKLATVASAANLRRMAREQKITLPEALRAEGASADDLRAGIADAVEKRIADRRAAAGG